MNITATYSKLHILINRLNDIIDKHHENMRNNPRAQLNMLFMSNIKNDSFINNAIRIRDNITELSHEIRAAQTESKLNEKLKELNDIITEMQNNCKTDDIYFLLGDNGIAAKIAEIFPKQHIPEQYTKPQETKRESRIYMMIHHSQQQWPLVLQSIEKIAPSRPIHENINQALSRIVDEQTAVVELEVNPQQLLRIATHGSNHRLQLCNITIDDCKYLYTKDQSIRYKIQDANLILESFDKNSTQQNNFN